MGSTFLKEVLVKGKSLNKQRSVWRRRGGSSSAMAIPLGEANGGSEASETIDRCRLKEEEDEWIKRKKRKRGRERENEAASEGE